MFIFVFYFEIKLVVKNEIYNNSTKKLTLRYNIKISPSPKTKRSTTEKSHERVVGKYVVIPL